MTVASKDGFGASRYAPRGGNPWRRLWQVPLLFVGLAVFGLGIRQLVRAIKPVPFEVQAKSIQAMLTGEKYPEALNEINRLAPYYPQPPQQGTLEKLAGDALFLGQSQSAGLVRLNYQHAMEHYAKAVALGIEPTAEMNERWGEAAMALGDATLAMQKLEAAMAAADGDSALVKRHARELVAAYTEAGQSAKAMAMVNQMLTLSADAAERDDLTAIEERTWALCKRIEIALSGGVGDRALLSKVVENAREAVPSFKERDPGGRVLVWIGRAELEQNDMVAAQRDLAEARSRFAVHHMDDGRAAVLLAKIAESHGDLATAATLFQEVVTGQAGTSLWASARLGRAQVAVRRGNYSEQVVTDYRFVIAELQDKKASVGKRPEMISKEQLQQSLLESYQRSADAGKLQEALTFLGLEALAQEAPTADSVYRLAITRERRAVEIMAEADKLEGAARTQQVAAARAMFADAAQDYLTHSRLTTLNDAQSGASLWKAGELLDAAGLTMPAAAVYERYTIQRPGDPHVPEGLLTLGRLYESAGMTEKAIAAYQRNITENPRTPAAYTSGVSMARCYGLLASRATKPEEKAADIEKAEQLLLGLVQSADLQPVAREFRESLLALGDLYYANGRWSEAILRLDEVATRYPADAAVPRALFMLAESYRKSAGDIAEALKDPAIPRRAELERARSERLLAAGQNFARVIALLDAQATADVSMTSTKRLTALEEQYLRSSYMDRAECYFQRGDFEQAIKLYDEASARFSEEVIAAQAYVQIVNAYMALKLPVPATAAAERGRWILKRIPDSAFGQGIAPDSREHYESLLAIGKF